MKIGSNIRLLFCALIAVAFIPSIVESQPDPSIKPETTRNWPNVNREDGKFNPLVTAIQYLLRSRGHNLKVDGIFGNQTAWEVKRFQRNHQIKDTGKVDDDTWEALVFVVERDSKGDAVRACQNRLKRNGYDVSISGKFDKQTQKAVRLFQSTRSNAYINGIVDRRTWCFLVNGSVVP